MREWCLGLDGHQGRAARRHQILVAGETYCRTKSAKIIGCLWEWCLYSFECLVIDSCLQNWSESHCRRPSAWEAFSRLCWHSNSLITKRQSMAFSPNSCSGALHSSRYGAMTFTGILTFFAASLSLSAISLDRWVKAKMHRVLYNPARQAHMSENHKLRVHRHERWVMILLWKFLWSHLQGGP
jgi:hypothetical protein